MVSDSILNIFNKLKQKLSNIFSLFFSNKLILTFSSFYVFLLFYFLANEILLFNLKNYLNYLIYFIFGLILSYFCLISIIMIKHKDNQTGVSSITPVEAEYIPVYLGLIIISLELNTLTESFLEVSILISLIYLIWWKLENVSFFNFYWLFFGYRFYKITTINSSYILITKRKDVKNKNTVKSLVLKRINNYTFLEL